MIANNVKILKRVLRNGLTVLVAPVRTIPKVSAQIWYNVGSKHEKDGEKGLAHLIEHMVFKGTKNLSESDINLITTKLSGSCNAFTAHDYTGYLFDFPTQNWKHALSILSDCMCNCTFKEELLNSELKAVIQELKMYKDNYTMSVVEELMGAIFTGHPYNYPIIGYKGDLYNLDSESLHRFYQKHYTPQNATLIVVGDVDAEDVFAEVEQEFGAIEGGEKRERDDFYLERDFSAKSVTLYRDVKQPIVVCAFMVPGSVYKIDYVLDVLSWLVGSGRGSRLYKRLVNELGIATEVESFAYDLFEHGLFFVQVQPQNIDDIPAIIKHVKEEVQKMLQDGFSDKEIDRAKAKANADYLSLLEGNQNLAYAIGKTYLATGDESYLLKYQDISTEELRDGLENLFETCLNPELMHTGFVLPLQEDDRDYWEVLQAISDQEDERVLRGKSRTMAVEEGRAVCDIEPKDLINFSYPKAETFTLENGLEVLYYHDDRIPKVEAILELKSDFLYDPSDKEGLSNFVSKMLTRGTSHFSAEELADQVEQKGMALTATSGVVSLSMLSKDFVHGFSLLYEILAEASFDESMVEKVRKRLYTDIADYWDQPYQFCNDLIRKEVYKNHPYTKNLLGTRESVATITRDDLIDFYKRMITPRGARLVIVGDLSRDELKKNLEDTIGKWSGPEVDDIKFPSLASVDSRSMSHYINRDQVVMSFAGLSVDRKHADYDKLLLFDQVFGSGVLGSMSSRLFQLREQTGMFYTISGSLLARSGKQPGIALVKTIVSLDRLEEAEEAIVGVINQAADTVTDIELQEACRALVNSMVDNFESYRQTAAAFLFLRRYNLPSDYFDMRAQQLQRVSLQDVQDAVKRVLDTNKMITLKVGRV